MQEYDDNISANPKLGHIINKIKTDNINHENYFPRLTEQYIGLSNLGYNIFDNFDDDFEFDISVIHNFLDYINENYAIIDFNQYIKDGSTQIKTIFKLVYEFLFVDMVNEILPNVCKKLNINESRDLGIVNIENIKTEILLIVQKKINIMQEANNGVGSTINNINMLKYAIGLDMFDSDVYNLSIYMFPVILNNSEHINMKLQSGNF